MAYEITRFLAWYEKDPKDGFIGREDLKDICLSKLQGMFSVPEADPMFACWPVCEEHIENLQKHVSHEIDLEKYDYFVEARGK